MDPLLSPRASLLQALAFGPGTALELMDRVRALTAGRIALPQRDVYEPLRALTVAGLVVVDVGTRRYALTDAGEKQAESDRKAILGLVRDLPLPSRRLA